MRTNIEIDDGLIDQVLKETGLPTKRAAVEAGLKLILQMQRQKRILDLAGKVHWDGDLDEMRQSRFQPE